MNYEELSQTWECMILGLKHHMESIEKKKIRQFEEIMAKEILEWLKREHGWKLELKKTKVGEAYRGKLEMEKLQEEKLRIWNEKQLKCTETEIKAKESNQ